MPGIVSDTVDCYVFRRRIDATDVLLLKRAEGGYLGGTWHAVHGRIEPGETAWQEALRELMEETKLRPVRFYQLDLVNTFYMAGDDAVHCCPCFAVEVSADATPTLNPEHTEYRWVPVERAAGEFLWLGQRRAMHELLEAILSGPPSAKHMQIPLPEGD